MKETFLISVRELVNGRVIVTKKEAEGSRLKNEYGLDLFVHKHKNGYVVSEAKSGYRLSNPYKTKREAVSEYIEVLKVTDIEQLKSKIDEVLKEEL